MRLRVGSGREWWQKERRADEEIRDKCRGTHTEQEQQEQNKRRERGVKKTCLSACPPFALKGGSSTRLAGTAGAVGLVRYCSTHDSRNWPPFSITFFSSHREAQSYRILVACRLI